MGEKIHRLRKRLALAAAWGATWRESEGLFHWQQGWTDSSPRVTVSGEASWRKRSLMESFVVVVN